MTSNPANSRSLLKPAFATFHAALLILLLLGFSVWAQKLYVYYPATIRPYILNEKLQALCSGVEIMVFGRYIDFQTRVEADRPDAVLTLPAVVDQNKDYAVQLTGHRVGRAEESYVLLSVEKKLERASLPNAEIGVIDILGRDGMNRFVQNLLGLTPKLKRVNKIEDLLPLLTFNMAGAALIPERYVEYFAKTSKLKFETTEIAGAKAGIVVLAVRPGANAGAILQCVRRSVPELNGVLSIDQWK